MISKIKYALHGVKMNAQIPCFRTNTHTKAFASPIICIIDYTLLKIMPDNDQSASVHWRHELSRPAAAFLSIFCSQAGSDLCCWVPKIWLNESGTGICRSRRMIVSHALWAAAGALHCWKVKNTAQISRIAGSSLSVRNMSPLIFRNMRHWSSLQDRRISAQCSQHGHTRGHHHWLLKVECVCSRHFCATWLFFVAAGTQLSLFWGFLGVAV